MGYTAKTTHYAGSASRHPRIAKIKRAISTAAQALSAAFRPKNLRSAFRTVTFGRKEYACFFVALLLVQTGFWTLSLTTDADLASRRAQIADDYNYHFEVVGLDNGQMTTMNNAFKIELDTADDRFDTITMRQEADGSYTFRIKALDGLDPSHAYNHTVNMLNKNGIKGWSINTSPLYEYESTYRTPLLAAFWGIAAGWLLLGLVTVIVLYLIRLDHFRFTYGIYMTCGADYPMLYGTAAGEMTAVSALTFIPAGLLGWGLTALLYAPRGVPLSFTVRTGVCVPLLCLAVVLLSVGIPMRKLSRQPPVQLLAAGDNAGQVTSPRRSFKLFSAAFPSKYELATMWRMRKYYIRLLISAVLFAAMFVSGLYIAGMTRDMTAQPAYEYTVTFAGGYGWDEDGEYLGLDLSDEELEIIRTDADYFLPALNEIEGVDYVGWKAAQTGGWYNSHLLLMPGQSGGGAKGMTVVSNERKSDGYTTAIRDYEYTAVDKAWLDMLLENDLCTVEGDPYKVLTDPHAVIMSEDVYNKTAFNFRVGDRVTVAKWLKFKGVIDPNLVMHPQELLRQQIAKSEFKYHEFTVCAVLHGLPAEANITFGVSYDTYEELTGDPALRNTFMVYMENGASDETVRAADGDIRRTVAEMGDWRVSRTGNFFRSRIKAERNGAGLAITLGTLLLIVSPLVWLFSQIMFYRRRRGEFDLLHALGAPDGTLPKLFRQTGGILSGLAFLVTILLSCLCNWAVYTVVTVLLPKLHLTEAVSYDYRLSLPALAACVAVSVICGFMSCEIPYRLIRRQSYTQRRDY